MTSTVI